MLGYWKHPKTNRIRLYLKQDLTQSLLGEHYTGDTKLWFEEDKRTKRGWKLHAKELSSEVSVNDLEHQAIASLGLEAPTWHDLLAHISTSAPPRYPAGSKSAGGSAPSAPAWQSRRPGSREGEAGALDVSSIRMNSELTIEVDHRETADVTNALDSYPQITVFPRPFPDLVYS